MVEDPLHLEAASCPRSRTAFRDLSRIANIPVIAFPFAANSDIALSIVAISPRPI